MSTLSHYYLNWAEKKDASVYQQKSSVKVEIYDMEKDIVIQTKTFTGEHCGHNAQAFACRVLNLTGELRKLMEYHRWCVDYHSKYGPDAVVQA